MSSTEAPSVNLATAVRIASRSFSETCFGIGLSLWRENDYRAKIAPHRGFIWRNCIIAPHKMARKTPSYAYRAVFWWVRARSESSAHQPDSTDMFKKSTFSNIPAMSSFREHIWFAKTR
jgi:hypothetical protein